MKPSDWIKKLKEALKVRYILEKESSYDIDVGVDKWGYHIVWKEPSFYEYKWITLDIFKEDGEYRFIIKVIIDKLKYESDFRESDLVKGLEKVYDKIVNFEKYPKIPTENLNVWRF